MPRIINIEASDSEFISGEISGVGSLLAAIPHMRLTSVVPLSPGVLTSLDGFPPNTTLTRLSDALITIIIFNGRL